MNMINDQFVKGAIDKRALLAAMLRRKASEQVNTAPVSQGQKALWFLHESAKDSAAYNVACSVRIRSSLNVGALKAALQSLLDRHAALRTRFKMRDGELMQEIHRYQPLAFEQTPMTGCSAEQLRQQVATFYHRPFDLENGPLFRTHLFSCAPDDHVLLIVVSHIVYDGWSLWLNLEELGRLYQSEAAGSKAQLTPLNVSYQDFVSRQQEMLAGAEGERLWNFWKEQLAGDLPTLNLPTDHTRPPVQTFRGASQKIKLDSGLAQQLKKLSKDEGVTPFTLLLAAFHVLLHRYSGQDDILVGVPAAGMRGAEFADVVGYFVNPVPVRADLSGNPAFRSFLAQAHQTVLGALEHQDFPFPLLVERLRPKRDPSHSPLFQASFVFQRTQRSGSLLDLTAPGDGAGTSVNWGGLEVEHYDLAQQEGQFDLELELVDGGNAVFGSFKYNTDLFEAATIERLAENFSALLGSIVADPAQPVGELPILSPTARAHILAASAGILENCTGIDCLHRVFEAHARNTPDAVALVVEGRHTSYRELNAKADSLAKYLQQAGVGPDMLVGLCVERSPEMVLGILGILKAGGAYVPIDPATPLERRAFIVEDSGVTLLLTQHALAGEAYPPGAKVVCLDADWEQIAAAADVVLNDVVEPDNLAYVIYTSGTTGKPKGVQITHRNVARLFAATEQWYGFNAQDVWPLFHSFAFDVSVWEFWGAYLHGGRLVMVPYLTSRSPSEFHALVVREGVTVLNQTPSAFRLFMQADTDATVGQMALRFVIFAGEALDIQSLRPWFERHGDVKPTLINKYGITETTVHVSYRPLAIGDLASARSMIGVPIPDLQMLILDRFLQPVPTGVAGEIHVGGAGLARGYLHRPELDAARFIPHPYSTAPGARLYKSGDLARFSANGDIEYLGRLDNQVKIRGFRIELGEIETVLGSHPAVSAAVVRVHKEPIGGSKLVAYVVARESSANLGANVGTKLGATLRNYLASKLPDYMVPSIFMMLDGLPLTGNGKLDYRALPAPENTRSDGAQTLILPRDHIERGLARLWEKVLGIESVGVQDDFFQLGGHSMLAVYLMAEIERQFGQALPPATLFRNPTIEKLAQSLRENAAPAPWSPLVPIRASGSKTPLFCVAGGGGNVLYFHQLAHRLPDDRPFYGLQAIGLDGKRAPLASVEEIAAEYIHAIRTVQPHGPYLLAGHCFGSWVAFEMAHQLQLQDEEVAAVLVINAPAPLQRPVPAGLDEADDAAWLAKFGSVLSEGAGQDLGVDPVALRCLGSETAQLDYFKARLEAAGMLPPDTPLDQVRGLVRVFVQNSKSVYAPRHAHRAPVVLFRASEFHPDYDFSAADEMQLPAFERALGWRAFSNRPVPVHAVPGNHITMLSAAHAGDLAEKIALCLPGLLQDSPLE